MPALQIIRTILQRRHGNGADNVAIRVEPTGIVHVVNPAQRSFV
jgi:hypothetical protein